MTARWTHAGTGDPGGGVAGGPSFFCARSRAISRMGTAFGSALNGGVPWRPSKSAAHKLY